MQTNKTTRLNWNVLDDVDFRQRARQVFEQTAEALEKSLGPYGANTILEQFGETHFTKDGWQILKKIHFEDNVNNTILMLLLNISVQVVNKVGDGSTSSIVAANQILKSLEGSDLIKTLRPKDLQDRLIKLANLLSEVVLSNSAKIDGDADPEFNDIYKLAMISTNGDEKISRFLQTIYSETKNPSVDYVKSKTNKTYYEIVEGFQGPIALLNDVFANDEENRTCRINNPMILMFDHMVTLNEHLTHILPAAAHLADTQKRRLVVVAPNYDRFALGYFNKFVNAEITNRGTTQVVYTLASLMNNVSRDTYNDFAVMSGAKVVTENDVMEILSQMESDEPIPVENQRSITDFIGGANNIVISPEGTYKTIISGFVYRNENLYNIAVMDAKTKYKKLQDQSHDLNIVSMELLDLKRRVMRLSGKLGTIFVGGSSSLEKTANYDLVDDAVKACESAFNYGYNMGGNMSIIVAINELVNNNDFDAYDKELLRLLAKAFRNVFGRVIANRDGVVEESYQNALIDLAIDKGACYDLITDTFNEAIINPCYTDVEILKAATSIVGLLITSNQFVSIYKQLDQYQQ